MLYFFFSSSDLLPVYNRAWKKKKIHVVQAAVNAALLFSLSARTDTMMLQESVVGFVLCETMGITAENTWLL